MGCLVWGGIYGVPGVGWHLWGTLVWEGIYEMQSSEVREN